LSKRTHFLGKRRSGLFDNRGLFSRADAMLKPCLLSLFLAVVTLSAGAETVYNLGVAAYKQKDYSLARQHWAAAVEEGEPLALNNLGFLLYRGLDGDRDVGRPVDLWRRGAEAQWHLGQMHERGEGVPEDVVVAYAWYKCAVVSAEALFHAEGSDAEETIAGNAARSLVRVLAKLTLAPFEKAGALSSDYIVRHAAGR
jgi:hypothetical protein